MAQFDQQDWKLVLTPAHLQPASGAMYFCIMDAFRLR